VKPRPGGQGEKVAGHPAAVAGQKSSNDGGCFNYRRPWVVAPGPELVQPSAPGQPQEGAPATGLVQGGHLAGYFYRV
jgi:hypothetical protein